MTSLGSRPLLALALLVPACTDYNLAQKKDDVAVGVASIDVAPSSLDFGEAAPGDDPVDVFEITSTGSSAVEIQSLAIELGEAFTILTDPPGDLLEPGDTFEVIVQYHPMSPEDTARAVVTSSAENAVEVVTLRGTGLFPQLTLDPASLEIVSVEGSNASGTITATNTGASTLTVSSTLVQGSDWFTVGTPVPFSLEPGVSAPIDVVFTPLGYSPGESANLWIASDDPAGDEVVELAGTVIPPCLGIAEAWSKGVMAITYESGLTVQNTSDLLTICIDDWYFYLSDGTQDAGAGDPDYEADADYGAEGTIVLPPKESVTFDYAETTTPAWWCVEETQVTQFSEAFFFDGARIPEPLLTYMIVDNDNDEVWAYMRGNPVFAVGRTPGWVAVSEGGTAEVTIDVINLGRQAGTAWVSENIPAGYTAAGFDPAPTAIAPQTDGSTTYSFEVGLKAAQDTDRSKPTIYDGTSISYLLSPSAAVCNGRDFTNAPTAEWEDIDGITRVSDGSPLVVECW